MAHTPSGSCQAGPDATRARPLAGPWQQPTDSAGFNAQPCEIAIGLDGPSGDGPTGHGASTPRTPHVRCRPGGRREAAEVAPPCAASAALRAIMPPCRRPQGGVITAAATTSAAEVSVIEAPRDFAIERDNFCSGAHSAGPEESPHRHISRERGPAEQRRIEERQLVEEDREAPRDPRLMEDGDVQSRSSWSPSLPGERGGRAPGEKVLSPPSPMPQSGHTSYGPRRHPPVGRRAGLRATMNEASSRSPAGRSSGGNAAQPWLPNHGPTQPWHQATPPPPPLGVAQAQVASPLHARHWRGALSSSPRQRAPPGSPPRRRRSA